MYGVEELFPVLLEDVANPADKETMGTFERSLVNDLGGDKVEDFPWMSYLDDPNSTAIVEPGPSAPPMLQSPPLPQRQEFVVEASQQPRPPAAHFCKVHGLSCPRRPNGNNNNNNNESFLVPSSPSSAIYSACDSLSSAASGDGDHLLPEFGASQDFVPLPVPQQQQQEQPWQHASGTDPNNTSMPRVGSYVSLSSSMLPNGSGMAPPPHAPPQHAPAPAPPQPTTSYQMPAYTYVVTPSNTQSSDAPEQRHQYAQHSYPQQPMNNTAPAGVLLTAEVMQKVQMAAASMGVGGANAQQPMVVVFPGTQNGEAPSGPPVVMVCPPQQYPPKARDSQYRHTRMCHGCQKMKKRVYKYVGSAAPFCNACNAHWRRYNHDCPICDRLLSIGANPDFRGTHPNPKVTGDDPHEGSEGDKHPIKVRGGISKSAAPPTKAANAVTKMIQQQQIS